MSIYDTTKSQSDIGFPTAVSVGERSSKPTDLKTPEAILESAAASVPAVHAQSPVIPRFVRRRTPPIAGILGICLCAALAGCGTTPPPEPEGERIPVNFPDLTVRHDENIPITAPNDVQNRLTVEGPRVESSRDVMMKASDAAAREPAKPAADSAAPAPSSDVTGVQAFPLPVDTTNTTNTTGGSTGNTGSPASPVSEADSSRQAETQAAEAGKPSSLAGCDRDASADSPDKAAQEGTTHNFRFESDSIQ